MTSSALVTYITIFGGSTIVLALIVTMLQHLRPSSTKRERVL